MVGFKSNEPSRNTNKRYRFDETTQRPIAIDSPPIAKTAPPETHYVPYETREFPTAYQWASEQVARKFPGAVDTLATLDSLIKQQISGQ